MLFCVSQIKKKKKNNTLRVFYLQQPRNATHHKHTNTNATHPHHFPHFIFTQMRNYIYIYIYMSLSAPMTVFTPFVCVGFRRVFGRGWWPDAVSCQNPDTHAWHGVSEFECGCKRLRKSQIWLYIFAKLPHSVQRQQRNEANGKTRKFDSMKYIYIWKNASSKPRQPDSGLFESNSSEWPHYISGYIITIYTIRWSGGVTRRNAPSKYIYHVHGTGITASLYRTVISQPSCSGGGSIFMEA